MNFYATAKLAWDVDRDTDILWTDFFERFYGPAEEPMRLYWERWQQAMLDSNGHQWDWIKAYTPEVVAQCGVHLQEAHSAVERAAHTGTYSAERLNKVRGRLQLAAEGFRTTSVY